jgi:hypothetical protein
MARLGEEAVIILEVRLAGGSIADAQRVVAGAVEVYVAVPAVPASNGPIRMAVRVQGVQRGSHRSR